MRISSFCCVLLSAVSFCGLAQAGQSYSQYGLSGSFTLPAMNALDVLPDGRIVTLQDSDVLVETSVGSRQFSNLGTLPGGNFNVYGAAFLSVSPDGTKLAVGNNGGASYADFGVGIFDLATLEGDWYTMNHSLAAWIDNTTLAYTDSGVVNALDVTSDVTAPVVTTLISNVGGSSGAVVFDAAGNLYTANGYKSTGPSDTGWVKAFAQADWTAALAGGSVLDFEAEGTLVGDILSGGSFVFDAEGNLLVGGGDFAGFTTFDYAALVDSDAIAAVLAGGAVVDCEDPTQVRQLDPHYDNDYDYYYVNFNPVTGEFLVQSNDIVYTYVVPEPMSLILLSLVGVLAVRRR